jgi:hypothetical protein
MITLGNIVIFIVGIALGVALGKRRQRTLQEADREAHMTHTPSVILLDGGTGEPRDITEHEKDEPPRTESISQRVDREIEALFMQGLRKQKHKHRIR